MLIAWAFFAPTGLLAQQPKPSEYQVKAAYLYNFGSLSNGLLESRQSRATPSPFACSVRILSARLSIPLSQVKRWTESPS